MCCTTHEERDRLADMTGQKYERAPTRHLVCQCTYGEPCHRTGEIPDATFAGAIMFLCPWCSEIGLNGHAEECAGISRRLAVARGRREKSTLADYYRLSRMDGMGMAQMPTWQDEVNAFREALKKGPTEL